MNPTETKGVLALLRAACPNFYKDMPRADLLAVVNLWQKQFEEFDGSLVLAAVNSLISSRVEGFPPTIGAVKEQIRKLTAPEKPSETEAWALVSRATRNGLYGYKEEFEKLPPDIRRVVGSPEQLKAWAAMEADEVESVIASHFMRAYRMVEQRDREAVLLPRFIRDALPEFKMTEEIK